MHNYWTKNHQTVCCSVPYTIMTSCCCPHAAYKQLNRAHQIFQNEAQTMLLQPHAVPRQRLENYNEIITLGHTHPGNPRRVSRVLFFVLYFNLIKKFSISKFDLSCARADARLCLPILNKFLGACTCTDSVRSYNISRLIFHI